MLVSNKINFKKYIINIKIYDMLFKLSDIIFYGDYIKISATTSNENYKFISNLLDYSINSHIKKQDVTIYKDTKILGISIIDFDFNQWNMNVEFNAERIIGDIENSLIQLERKEKIKKIQNKHKDV